MQRFFPILCNVIKWLFIGACLASMIGLSTYNFFGHTLIESAYYGKSIPFLNNIIEGRDVHPLEYYLQIYDQWIEPKLLLLYKITIVLTLLYLSCWLITKKFWAHLVILSLFLIAFWVRFPHLDRPLGDHHEWVTEHTLIILQNWESQGALKHKFDLLMTFPGENNRGVAEYTGRLINKAGEGYYVSFPPGAVIWPYLIFKLLGLSATPLNLQVLNIFFHLIASLIFFFITKKILSASYYPKEALAVIGVLFLLFLPGHLWFFSNIYSWDIFWFYALLAATACTLTLKERIDTNQPLEPYLGLYGVSIFVLIYSDIYGLLYALTVILFTLEMMGKNKAYKKIIPVTLAAFFAAFLLTALQYSSIAGPKSLWECLLSTRKNYLFQGLGDFQNMWLHARTAYNLLFIPLVITLAAVVIQQKKNFLNSFSSLERAALFLTFSPAVLFYMIQTRWSAIHDYSMLRIVPFLILALIILLSKLRIPLTWTTKTILAVLIWKFLWACIYYYGVCFSYSADVSFFKRHGEFIRNNANDDEVVFIVTEYHEGIDPRYSYYARRNVQWIGDPLHAVGWLLTYGKQKGVAVYFDHINGATNPKRIDLGNLSEELSKYKIKDFQILKDYSSIKKIELILEDGGKRIMRFKNGLMLSDSFINPQGQRTKEITVDYWTLDATQTDYDDQGNIATQKELL